MKTLISIATSLCLLLSSCSSFNAGGVKPLINAAVLVAANQYAQRDAENVGKILDLALVLELAADAVGNALSKQDFVDLVSKVDVEWAYLGTALYDVYAANVLVPEQYSKHSETLRQLATTLRDSVITFIPQK